MQPGFAQKYPTLASALSAIGALALLVVALVVGDFLVLHNLLGFGYPRHYHEENALRYRSPYVEFTGRPGVLDHNAMGFRGRSLDQASEGDLRVAFFGGSTGYHGKPPIATLIEQKLTENLKTNVFVANFSVVSSNHRQHLHGMLEFLPRFKPDVVIFYGGYNETVVPALYDPRPGYPFNFFYRGETSAVRKALLERSALVGEFDKSFGGVTPLARLRAEQKPFSEPWRQRVVRNYSETLELAHGVAGALESGRYGNPRFSAFYQPYRLSPPYEQIHSEVKAAIGETDYIYDVSDAYDELGTAIYRDAVHVNQQAKEVMATVIADIVGRALAPGT